MALTKLGERLATRMAGSSCAVRLPGGGCFGADVSTAETRLEITHCIAATRSET